MEEGLIGKWLKNEGETVEEGEPLCEVETEKTVDMIEAPASGLLHKIVIPTGNFVSINQVIAVIAQSDEEIVDLGKVIEEAKETTLGRPKPEIKKTEKMEIPEVVEEKKMKLSPLARKLAEKHGIDITGIDGTGPGGRIVKRDIQKAIKMEKVLQAPVTIPTTVERGKVIPFVGRRKVIADRLFRSARTALHVPLTIEVDMSETSKLREELNTEYEKRAKTRLSYTDILVKAVAAALKEHPIVNSILENGQIKIIEEINIGVAVATNEGLIVPVVRDADEKSLREIAVSIEELVEKARLDKLVTREVSGGTFTITNLGMFEVDLFAPIINPPESAILGVGRITKKPIAMDDEVVVRPMVTLTLVFDHRIMDGAEAARFLQEIKQVLEEPHLYLL